MSVDVRFAHHAREWSVSIDEIRATETSKIGLGTRRGRPVVLKVIRRENSEEWRCGEILEAFRGGGVIEPLEHAPGAVLLRRLVPGRDLASLCEEENDDEATNIVASLMERMARVEANVPGIGSVDRLLPDFQRFRAGGEGFIPADFVDRAEGMFMHLCSTQSRVRLLHGDFHHFNVLFDEHVKWVAIDPWGVVGEREFELGASLRNPTPALVEDSGTLERRLRRYEARLELNGDRALKWAFATTVLAILWPFEHGVGPDLRPQFSLAARAMDGVLRDSGL